jgi:hypothetical protein
MTHRVYAISFASVYPQLHRQGREEGRTKAEVDRIILWLTGYTEAQFEALLADKTDLRTFYAQAPA